MAVDVTGPFVVGGNVPWIDCGWDFGEPPPGYPSRRHDWTRVREELCRLRELGLSVLRFWVLAGGVSYPGHALGDVARLRRGWDGGHWHFRRGVTPPMLGAASQEDFAALCEACGEAGVQLLPSLMSFEWFLPARGQRRGRGPLVFGERAQDERACVERFLAATLQPLLDVSRGYASAIHAFELINEPDWVTRGGPRLGPGAWSARVPARAMGRLLLRGVERIVAAGLVASIGFADMRAPWLPARVRGRLALLAQQGQYLHQHHHYPSLLGHWRLPSASSSPIRPVLLGELPAAQGRWDGHNLPWFDAELRRTERDPQRYLAARIQLARARGYSGALLWSTPTALTGPGQDRRSPWTTRGWSRQSLLGVP